MPGQAASPALPSETPNVAWGPTSTLGTLLTLLAAIGTVVAAVKGNDTATATSGAAAVLAAVTTLGGRMAQAVAIARSVAVASGPWIDALHSALAAPSASQQVTIERLVETTTRAVEAQAEATKNAKAARR